MFTKLWSYVVDMFGKSESFHIHQIGTKGDSYTVVLCEDNLEEHPSIVKYPKLFEIVNGDLPKKYQILDFSEGE